MVRSDCVPIIYPPGAYGHYIFWILNNFTERGNGTNKTVPFDKYGGSHGQIKSKTFCKIEELQFNSMKKQRFFHAHCVQRQDIPVHATQFNILNNWFSKWIIVATDKCMLTRYNNLFEKATNCDIDVFSSILPTVMIDSTMSVFEVREMLSYKLFYPVPWISSNNIPGSFDLKPGYLLYDFENTLNKLCAYLDTTISSDDMLFLIKTHKTFMSLQQHLHKDEIVAKFLTNFKEGLDVPLPDNLSIIDEAYIQHYLRDTLHLEIKCDGLDVFPSSTTKLREITYPAEDLIRE